MAAESEALAGKLVDSRAMTCWRNRRRLVRNGFAMLRWYQRLGHDRQDERVVWLASGRHQVSREAAESMASRG